MNHMLASTTMVGLLNLVLPISANKILLHRGARVVLKALCVVVNAGVRVEVKSEVGVEVIGVSVVMLSAIDVVPLNTNVSSQSEWVTVTILL